MISKAGRLITLLIASELIDSAYYVRKPLTNFLNAYTEWEFLNVLHSFRLMSNANIMLL